MIRALLSIVSMLSLLRSAHCQSNAERAAANDLTVLNYALTLEHLEAAFYDQGLARYNASQFAAAGYNGTVYAYLQMIQSHEASHVSFLTNAINTASSGSAVPACVYSFSAALASPASFLATAAVLENTGQTAYDGAVNGITNADYARVAAQIATVEARHAAWLNNLTNASPFPQPFDTANLPSTIATAIRPFLVSCPYNITLPTVRPSGVTLDSNGRVVATGILSPSYTRTQQDNDITALNYALTLENLENAFYIYSLARFSSADFVAAGLPSYYYDFSRTIADHEQVHVTTLNTTINARVSGAGVPACVYNFSSITNVTQYLATARLLENVGVMAYDGAVNTITDSALQQIAATIATVEARHAAFLNQANGGSPFPDAQDEGKTPTDIINMVLASGLVVSCPYTPTGPVVVPVLDNGADINRSMVGQMMALVMGVAMIMVW